MALKRRPGSKNPPVFSHEFVIQNHADIVSCVAMVFVIGLLFQATAPLASYFVAMHHNVTETFSSSGPVLYTYGPKDFCVIFFYFLIAIVMHAIIQEYILDKLNRKMHLSKVKHSKFNESGQLLIFYLMSLMWGGDIILREGYIPYISKVWENYPHSSMSFMFKFYFIVQLSYWMHGYPELYFQKIKKDEMGPRIVYTTLYLIFFGAAYMMSFTRIAIFLSVMHYVVESIFHTSRLLYFAEKSKPAKYGFMVWNVCFVGVRLMSIVLSVWTFWSGLAGDNNTINVPEGNFNTPPIRISCLAAVCLLQTWMMWNFIIFHVRRMREQAALVTGKKKALSKRERRLKRDDARRTNDEDVNELPEVDQNTKKDLRARTAVAGHIKTRRS